jgi:hypothetical protein
MSMRPQNIPDIPQETVKVACSAFLKGNIYLQIRDTLGSIFCDEAFVELFPQRGQSAFAPWRLALICEPIPLIIFSESRYEYSGSQLHTLHGRGFRLAQDLRILTKNCHSECSKERNVSAKRTLRANAKRV